MYGIKIDLRKKSTFDDVILECIKNNQLWCNETEEDYVEKKFAKRFKTKEKAECSITEEWEIVCKLSGEAEIDENDNVYKQYNLLTRKADNVVKETIYRPEKIEVKNTPNGGFKVVDSENDDYQLATILEFNPENSDLPIKETREFVEYLIEYYNHNYK